jgi:hypothetical protein
MFVIKLSKDQNEIIEKVIELIKKYGVESNSDKLLEIHIYIDDEHYVSKKYRISEKNAYKLTTVIPNSYVKAKEENVKKVIEMLKLF